MKKRNLLLSLVLILTFIGGFYTGVWVSPNDKSQEITENGENSNKKQTSNDQTEKNKTIEKIESQNKEKEDDNKVLIGYVQDFRDPQTIDYSELTHIIFSFAHPTIGWSSTFKWGIGFK